MFKGKILKALEVELGEDMVMHHQVVGQTAPQYGKEFHKEKINGF
jgi:hypothetical protein